jgi:hypothetical protein
MIKMWDDDKKLCEKYFGIGRMYVLTAIVISKGAMINILNEPIGSRPTPS